MNYISRYVTQCVVASFEKVIFVTLNTLSNNVGGKPRVYDEKKISFSNCKCVSAKVNTTITVCKESDVWIKLIFYLRCLIYHYNNHNITPSTRMLCGGCLNFVLTLKMFVMISKFHFL